MSSLDSTDYWVVDFDDDENTFEDENSQYYEDEEE